MRYFMYQLMSRNKKDRDRELKDWLFDHKDKQPVEIRAGIEDRDALQRNWPDAKVVYDPSPSMVTMIWLGYLE